MNSDLRGLETAIVDEAERCRSDHCVDEIEDTIGVAVAVSDFDMLCRTVSDVSLVARSAREVVEEKHNIEVAKDPSVPAGEPVAELNGRQIARKK